MTDTVLMSEMSWVQYQRKLQQEDAPVLVPIGATEQHGPHLPLGTDWMIALAVAKEAAKQTGGVVASHLTYGYKSAIHSGGGNHFPGTTSLDGSTLIRVLADILKEIARHGAKKIVMVDIHYENHWFVTEGCAIAIRELQYGGIDDVRIIKPRLDAACDINVTTAFYEEGTFPGMALEHAGKLETSCMLYLYPELVQVDTYPPDNLATPPPYDCYPLNPEHSTKTGILAPIADASVEMGEACFKDLVNAMVKCIYMEFGDINK